MDLFGGQDSKINSYIWWVDSAAIGFADSRESVLISCLVISSNLQKMAKEIF